MKPEARPHWLLSGGGLCGRPVSVEWGQWMPASGMKEGREWKTRQTSGTLSKASPPSCHSACVGDKDKLSPGVQAYQLLSSHSTLQESFLQPHRFLNGPLKRPGCLSASGSISSGVSPWVLSLLGFQAPLRSHTAKGTLSLNPGSIALFSLLPSPPSTPLQQNSPET